MPGLADTLLALACVAILPFLLGRAVAPGIGWPARWWCGAALAGAVVLSGRALRVPPVPTLGAALLGGALAFLLSRRRTARVEPLSPRERRLLTVPVVLLALPAAAAVALAIHAPVPEGDGLVLWFAKTRGLFFWDPISRAQRPSYPELGPVFWTLPLRVVGLGYENVGRVLPPLVWLAWGIGLLGVPGRPYDVPALARGFAAATMARLLLRNDQPPTRSELFATGILTGSAALVKLEGTVWSLILGLTFLVALLGRSAVGGRRVPVRSVAPFVAAWVSVSALWPALLWWNGIPVVLQEGAFTTGSVLGAVRCCSPAWSSRSRRPASPRPTGRWWAGSGWSSRSTWPSCSWWSSPPASTWPGTCRRPSTGSPGRATSSTRS